MFIDVYRRKYMLKIGCHLSITKGLLNAAKQITSINGNVFQFFSRNPQGFKAKPFDKEDYLKFKEYSKENELQTILCHAPYTLNCCSSKKEIRDLAKIMMKDDLDKLEQMDNVMYNFHPGAHTQQGVNKGIEQISECLNEIVNENTKTPILLELMAGKGSDIGRTFEEIKEIIDKVHFKDKIFVCLDTCHVFAANYDIVNHLDDVLEEFDNVIGINKLKAIHLNDSKMPLGSYKDRHAAIGEGYIGKQALINIVNHPLLKDLPFYLETPHEDLDGYKQEIKLFQDNYKY